VSRSRLLRALLALASLLGAVPLMAQARVASVTTAPFPYGNYTATQPADSNHSAARTLAVELTSTAMKVYEGGELVSTYLINVSGRELTLWRVGGRCGDAQPVVGRYTWSISGDVLQFQPLDDPCPGRAAQVTATRLVRAPAPVATPAAPAFPFGRYVIQPLPGGDQNGAGLFIELGTSTTKVFNGGDLLETHGAAVDGDTWRIFEFTGECLDDGSYHWHYADGVLTFEIITDPCTQRAANVSKVRLVKQP
jgi:hypothetical protein